MPPQKAIPAFDKVYTYCRREDDGPSSSVRKLNERDENSYQRRGSNASTSMDDGETYIVGDRVWVGGTKSGVVAFFGETQFGPGDWAGVVLDEPIGKNDGAVAGIRYFQCAPNKGIFARPSRLSRFPTSSGYNHTPAPYSTPVTPERKRTLSSTSFGSSVASSRLRTPLSHSMGGNSEVNVGDRVIVQSSHGSKVGVLRYYGTTEFGNGVWCGVELDDPLGKNDGSVAGVKYFDCAPKFGLFVPAEKVSRSPISKKGGPPCVIHPDGISRQGTRESLRSTSTIQTSATSNFRTNRKPLSKTLGSSFTSAPKSHLQDQVKEKDTYIQQLLKERELERAQITTAATQAEEAEKKLANVKSEYEQIFAQQEIQNTNLSQTIEKLEKEKTDLQQQLEENKKKLEDLQFNFEEESITKSEYQALNEEYFEKLKNLEKVVSSQHASLDYDAQSSGIFTAEGGSEKGSSPGAQLSSFQADSNETNEELISSRKMILVLTEKTTELENECQQLRESLDKWKLVDKSKEEMINSLRNELTNYQQSNIGDDQNVPLAQLQTQVETSKLNQMEAENDSLKNQLSNTNDKLSTLEISLQQKNEELTKINSMLEDEQKEAQLQIEKVRIDLQFELDENKIRIEETVSKLDELTAQLTAKKKESTALAKCIAKLCEEIDQRNSIISRVTLDTEDAAENIAQAINAAINLRCKETTFVQMDDCDQHPKEIVQQLLERVEQSSENNIVLLRKLETLAEVISRKDTLLEESSEEKDALRKELQESVQQKSNELWQLETKYSNLDKVKIDLETQLKKSEENVKKLEQLLSGKDVELTNEVANIRCDLQTKQTEFEQAGHEIANLKEKLKIEETRSHDVRATFEKEVIELKSQIQNLNLKLDAVLQDKRKLRKEYIELRKLNEFTMRVIGEENEDSIENFAITLADNDDLGHFEAVQKNVRGYEEEYDRLKKTIDTLKSDNLDLQKKIASLEDTYKQGQQEKEVIELEQQQLQAQLKTTSNMVNALNEDYSEEQRKVAALENTCKQNKEEKEALKKEKEQLREELQKATITLESQKTQFADTESETATLREKLITSAITEAKLNDLKNEHTHLESSFKVLEESKNKLESELETMNKEKVRIKELLQTTNEEKQILSEKTDEYLSQIEKLRGTATERERESTELCSNLKILQDSLKALESAKTTLELELQKASKETIEIKNQLRNSHEEKDGLSKKVEELSYISKKMAERELELDKVRKELQTMQDSCSTSENSRKVLELELENSKTENIRIKDQLNKICDEKEGLVRRTHEFCLVDEKIAERERELSEVRKNLENLEDNFKTLENTKSKLELELETVRKENVQIRSQLNTSDQEKEKLVEEIHEISSDSKTMNEKMVTREHELTEIRTNLETLQVSFKRLENTNNKLEIELENAKKENELMKNELNMSNSEKENLVKRTNEYSTDSKNLNDKMIIQERELTELQKHLRSLKDGSSKAAEELEKMRNTNCILEQTNISLTAELDSVKEELARFKNTVQIHEEESNREKLILEEKIKSMGNVSDDIKVQEEKNRRQAAELNTKLQILQQELETKQRTHVKELSELEENVRKLNVEKESVVAQLEIAKNEIIKLNSSNSVQKIEPKLVSKDNLNNNVISADDAPSGYSQLIEDKITAENQVHFLNSVIVDMQRKNETLLERVQYLEGIIPPELLKRKKVVTPRLFCDICDMFDLHDTEDCPVQCGSSTPPPVRRETTKVKPPPRPYCENCEVFGHTREECNDDETF